MFFYEYCWAHPPKRARGQFVWLRWAVVAVAGLFAIVAIARFLEGERSFWVFLAPVCFIWALLVRLFFQPLRRWSLRRTLRRDLEEKTSKNAKQLGWKRLTLTPEAIIDTTEHSNSRTAWTAIEKIVIVGERALIFDSPTSAGVVPRRAFADDEEFREFVATARRYRDEARDALPERTPSRRKRVAEPETNIKPDERADR
jgi:hypothetical protein